MSTNRLTQALTSHYYTPRASDSIELYRGRIVLTQGAHEAPGMRALCLTWTPAPRVTFSLACDDPTRVSIVPRSRAIVHLTDRGTHAEVDVAGLKHQSNTWGQLSLDYYGRIAAEAVQGGSLPLSWVLFHVVNFHEFFGTSIEAPNGPAWAGRLVLRADRWVITLDSVQNLTGQEGLNSGLRDQAGYGITHIGKLEREDEGHFTTEEAEGLLDPLQWFLSFARGLWTAPVLPIGFDKHGNQVWEKWAALRVARWQFVHSWFPINQPRSLGGVFTGFLRRWQDPVWQTALRLATHWYLESNAQAGAIEGAIVSAQMAFETLAWTFFVEDQKRHSEAEFNSPGSFSAERKLRLLLAEAALPATVPARLAELSRQQAVHRWTDAPQALTRLRNMITHPTRENSAALLAIPPVARTQAWLLSLWYLELILLWLCDHRGPYFNRLTAISEDDLELVPWANGGTTASP